ncbi:MAG: DNA polymerase III subunit delta [Sulfurimonas sp. RIFCSPHIGHO2_12_FULL_36_9]|uniref:DNA polymerase III subunit delta n=1 Tax=Sulfurimonas sp. RIFCSPLOWO2_12_36_12 TaxID=1802253 RepID=UPI0008B7F7ED|nr:DNA polymerase III subunit delta [Sulfurimonas sp. RIFCSPLOWO2_12_36_12]OHD96595.1 MAG: DNA polymerase III subunit delta [Sulfurimonas sp. RIFCSPHIGHO2_12_FULL_36_9]OHD98693.1 MAG: DNA polymerase III subunit delta [Sulfurimonas sp. RIFCSPLOWO2_02_FULL_36_28]OHE02507.1 MAG: DNA polymerase III subunit delta [Sulfurimonas sp. RIFCSPLOWO2_12_36_12]OHE08431.1 MAG: DNA polymerase III subunit delta [Sulfurimonas sp. RIFCSPLOWO2_12_FULL_36_74]
MYKSELDKHIQNNSLSNSFILFGESTFLIDRYSNTLTNKEGASLLKFYHDEYNFNSAKAHLSQASLFGDQNILIIKSEKKIPKKDLDTLIEQCEKNPDNIFVYAYYGTDNTAYAKPPAKTKTMCVRFFHPNHSEAVFTVSQIAREKSVNIDSNTINHLLSVHSGDIALACNEIDKLKIYDRAITVKDIDNLVFGLAEINIDNFIKKVLNKKDFKADLVSLLEHGEDEIRVLTATTSYLTTLYMFNIYIRVNGAPNAIEILGYNAPKFVVDDKATMSIKIKPLIYYKLHELLLDSELKMKSSHVDKSAILLSTLIRVQQLL